MDDIKIDYKEQYDKLRKVIYSIDAEEYKKDKLKNIYEKNYDPNTERREEAVIEAEANKLIDLQQNFKNMEKNYKKIGLFNEFIRIIKRTGLKFDGCDYLLETDIYRKNKYNSLVDKDMDALKVNNKKNIKEVEELLKSCSNIPACKTSSGKAPLYAMLQVEQVRVTDARELGLMIQLLSEDTKLLTEFNVDIQTLNSSINAIKDINNPSSSILITNKSDFDILESIKLAKEKKLKSDSLFVSIPSLEKQFQSIIELSRETWYLEQVLKSFENTFISETEVYETLQGMIERQKQQLDEMSIKAVRNYHKSGLEIKIAVLEELDKKYNEAKRLKELIEELKNSDDYDKEQLDKLLEEYYSLVVDINKILDRNEYIDKKIYSEVIENNQLLEEQTNLKNNKSEKENEKTTISLNDSTFLEDDVNLKERIERINNNDLVIATTGLKFAAYSKYNMAKLTPGFNLSFSKFLEKNYNNPDYQSMIRNEREREEVAKIIYNEYVNNGIELSFEEYAKQKYGINFIDVPIEDSVQKNQDEDYEDIGTGKSR